MSLTHFVSFLLLLLVQEQSCFLTNALEVIQVSATDMIKQDGTEVVFTTERFESYAFIRTGDEIKFNITNNQSGVFSLHASISNPADLGAFAVTDGYSSQIYGAATSLPVTASWDEWNTVTIDNIRFTEGWHALELTVIEGGWKIQDLYLVQKEVVPVTGNFHYMVPGVDMIDFLGIEYYPNERIVARIDRGDWFAYNLPVKQAGNYTLHFYVSSPEGGGSFRVLNGATKKPYASIRTLPTTGDWLDWTIVDVPNIRLEAGNVPINISVTSDGWNFCMLTYELYDPKSDPLNSPTECGTNLTRTDLTVGETMTLAAETICDNEGISFETSSEGGLNIGWLDEGNWVAFDVNLATAGIYDVGVRYSSVDGDGGFLLSNFLTGDLYHAQERLEGTGDWQIWSTLQNVTLSFPSGTTVIQLKSLGGGWNLQSISLTRREAGAPISPPVSPPVMRPVAAPGQPASQIPVMIPLVGAAPAQSPLMTSMSGRPVLAPVPLQNPTSSLGQVMPVTSPIQSPLPARPVGQVMPVTSPVQAPLPSRPLNPLPVIISQTANAPVITPASGQQVQPPVPLQTPLRPSGVVPVPLQSAPVLVRAPYLSPIFLV